MSQKFHILKNRKLSDLPALTFAEESIIFPDQLVYSVTMPVKLMEVMRSCKSLIDPHIHLQAAITEFNTTHLPMDLCWQSTELKVPSPTTNPMNQSSLSDDVRVNFQNWLDIITSSINYKVSVTGLIYRGSGPGLRDYNICVIVTNNLTAVTKLALSEGKFKFSFTGQAKFNDEGYLNDVVLDRLVLV